MTPDYRLTADTVDVTDATRAGLVSLTVTDKEGLTSDEIELTLDDTHGRIALPRPKALLRVWIGFRGHALVPKGTFEVDEVEHSGPPDRIRIKGRAAQMTGKIKEQRQLSYHDTTLGDVLRQIAARNELTPVIGADYAALPLAHLDQTNESDTNLLARLGTENGAIATVKDGRLVFVKAGTGTGADGAKLPTATITRDSSVDHTFTIQEGKGGETGVKALFHDLATGETKAAAAGDTTGPTKTLREVYPTEHRAAAAATAAASQIKRDQRELSLRLAVGRPELIAGQPLTVTGFRPEIDGVAWVIEEVTHTLDGGGLGTSLKAKG